MPTTPPSWVKMLGELHAHPYYLRYATGVNRTGVNGIVSPGVEPMTSELVQIAESVERGIVGQR